jgi:DNA-binding response OmpR family regulator
LVEDDDAVRRVASNILSRSGYSVIDVGAIEDAERAWASQRSTIDLLITDVVLRKGSGAELARRLRSERDCLPVIYMSGYVGNLTENHKLLSDNAEFKIVRTQLLDLQKQVTAVGRGSVHRGQRVPGGNAANSLLGPGRRPCAR